MRAPWWFWFIFGMTVGAALIQIRQAEFICEELSLPKKEKREVEFTPPAPSAMEYKNWWNE